MIENIRPVGNPLTIIAIFAGLAEVAGTVVLGFLPTPLQAIFLWYVMGFPVALVIAFFATLNLNPSALYAPADFKDEENYLKSLELKTRVKGTFDAVSSEIQQAKANVADLATERNVQEQRRIVEELSGQIADLEKKITDASQAARAAIQEAPKGAGHGTLASRVLQFLAETGEPKSLSEIAEALDVPRRNAEAVMQRLVKPNFSGAVGVVYDEGGPGRPKPPGRPTALYILAGLGRAVAEEERTRREGEADRSAGE